MELFAKKIWREDERIGKVLVTTEYFIYHPEYGTKIYLKPADKTSSEMLDFLVYSKYIKIDD